MRSNNNHGNCAWNDVESISYLVQYAYVRELMNEGNWSKILKAIYAFYTLMGLES